jgi:hypothetical protein
MHDSPEYGYLRINGKPLPPDLLWRRTGCDSLEQFEQLIAELEAAGVPSRMADGTIYSRRMVRDEKRRKLLRIAERQRKRDQRAQSGKPSALNGNVPVLSGIVPPPSSSSSSSSPSKKENTTPPTPSEEGESSRRHKSGKRKKPEPTEAEFYKPEWANEPWGSNKKFIAVYNDLGPKEWPLVKIASNGLVPKIEKYLKQFPQQEFWETVFRNAANSNFCREYRNGTLAWLLQRGKDDQMENCVKVFEGKFDRRPALVS